MPVGSKVLALATSSNVRIKRPLKMSNVKSASAILVVSGVNWLGDVAGRRDIAARSIPEVSEMAFVSMEMKVSLTEVASVLVYLKASKSSELKATLTMVRWLLEVTVPPVRRYVVPPIAAE